MKRSGFKHKAYKPMKRTGLRVKGRSETTDIKDSIQFLIREIAIIRDGGCVLRHYREAGNCSGYRKDGELILQAEHLVTRGNGATYGDMRNVVCLCQTHHIFFKPQFSKLYWDLIRKHIGPTRWGWFEMAEADKKPYKMDWKLVEIDLKKQLLQIKNKNNEKEI